MMMGQGTIELDIAGQTDIGLKRSVNQDAFKIVDLDANSPYYILLVADGVGGNLPHGEVASTTAIKAFCDSFDPSGGRLADNVRAALTWTNRAVSEQATVLGIDIIGTTIAGMVIDAWGEGIQFNIGDTRIYRVKNQQVDIASHDDVTVSVSDNPSAKTKSKLNSFLGQPKSIEPNVQPIQIRPGEHYLICSDGFWGLVDDNDVLVDLFDGQSAQQISQQCIKMALKRGAPDNVTVIAIKSHHSDSTEPEIPVVNLADSEKDTTRTEPNGEKSPKRTAWLLGFGAIFIIVVAVLLWLGANGGLFAT